jgi:hypothetical protein
MLGSSIRAASCYTRLEFCVVPEIGGRTSVTVFAKIDCFNYEVLQEEALSLRLSNVMFLRPKAHVLIMRTESS